jgi:hypothetical protein
MCGIGAASAGSERREAGFTIRRAQRVLISTILILARSLIADSIAVRHTEGRLHGFLVLRDLEDHILASGDLSQSANGIRVTSQLTFHFKDGSLHDETTVFSQRRSFQLLTYHLVQKGRAFKHPMDMVLNAPTGQFTVHYTEDDGKEKIITDQLKLPADLANGFVTILLGDIDPKTPKTTVSMLVATPKPRVVKLEITPQGEDSFSIAGSTRKALLFNIKVNLGGIGGVVAPIIGKQPPDTHVWMIGGKVPGFLRSEGPMFEGGPIWRIELASPVWPKP